MQASFGARSKSGPGTGAVCLALAASVAVGVPAARALGIDPAEGLRVVEQVRLVIAAVSADSATLADR